MIRRLPVLLLATVLLVGAGWDRKARRAYEQHADEATRELKLYKGFGTALILRGTLLTSQFRTLLAAERRRLLGPAAADHEAFVAEMEREATAYHDVVFSADSPLAGGPIDFGTTDDAWRIRLLADGTEQPLVEVEQVRDPSTLQQALYPHYNRWSSLWVARFERTVQVAPASD